jgi:hypothetical protein
MNSTQPFYFANIKSVCLQSGPSGEMDIIGLESECPWVKKYLKCRNLAGPLIRAGIIPAVI